VNTSLIPLRAACHVHLILFHLITLKGVNLTANTNIKACDENRARVWTKNKEAIKCLQIYKGWYQAVKNNYIYLAT